MTEFHFTWITALEYLAHRKFALFVYRFSIVKSPNARNNIFFRKKIVKIKKTDNFMTGKKKAIKTKLDMDLKTFFISQPTKRKETKN